MSDLPDQLAGRGSAAAGWWHRAWGRTWSTTGHHARPLAWVLGGKLALIGGNAALTLILARLLELEWYGIFVAAIGLQLLISRAILLGVETGLMRLQTLADLGERTAQVGIAGLIVILATTTMISLGSLGIAPFWAWPAIPRWAMVVVIGGALGTALVDYGYHYRLAGFEFRAAVAVQGGTAMARALATCLAAAIAGGHAMVTFVVYAGVTAVSGVMQAVAVARGRVGTPPSALVWRLVRYSAWIGVANVLVVLSLYEGSFLLLHLQQPAAASIFGLALSLSLGFFALYNAFYEYSVARIVRLGSPQEIRRFVVRGCGAALALSLVCAPVIGLIGWILPHLVGGEFAGAETVFFLLAASMLVLVLQAPLEAACHALLRPQLILLGWGVRVVAIAFLVWCAAPEVGALGVALAQLGGGVVAAAALAALVGPRLRSPGRNRESRVACAG